MCWVRSVVIQGNHDFVGLVDDVVVGNNVATFINDHPRARPLSDAFRGTITKKLEPGVGSRCLALQRFNMNNRIHRTPRGFNKRWCLWYTRNDKVGGGYQGSVALVGLFRLDLGIGSQGEKCPKAPGT